MQKKTNGFCIQGHSHDPLSFRTWTSIGFYSWYTFHLDCIITSAWFGPSKYDNIYGGSHTHKCVFLYDIMNYQFPWRLLLLMNSLVLKYDCLWLYLTSYIIGYKSIVLLCIVLKLRSSRRLTRWFICFEISMAIKSSLELWVWC